MLAQALGPALERRGLGRQREAITAGAGLRVGAPEILEEDAPRDAVDREVMHRDEQARRSRRAEVEVGDTEHRPDVEIEAGLRLGGGLLDRRGDRGRGHGGEIDDPERRGLARRREDLLEAACDRAEAQAEGVVVLEEAAHGALQRGDVEPLRELEQEGLVPVVRAVDRERRPPALDRGERRGAGDRPLLGVDGDAARRGDLGELGDGLMLEDLPRRDQEARLLRARHYLDREDRVAADREEVVVDPDLLPPQHHRPDPDQLLFHRGARGDEGLARRDLAASVAIRRRERRAIDLPLLVSGSDPRSTKAEGTM